MTGRPPRRRAAPPEPPLDIHLRAESRRWSSFGKLADLRLRVAKACDAALAVAPLKPLDGAELNILLTDDARIRRVHRDWRGFDKATNVLSFPAVPPARIAMSPALGDIVLAHETLAREAEAEGKSLEEHFSHLVIHGLLHLLGEDHETEAEADRMEALEIEALARLGIRDPYADSEPVAAAARPLARQSSSS